MRGVRGRPGKLPPACVDELIAFAEHHARLLLRGPDGLTALEHAESYERQTGKTAPELEGGPELPPDGAHVWSWFLELNAARGSGGFGPACISYVDVLAWTTLSGTLIRPSEVAAIMAIDRAWLAGQIKPDRAARPRGKGNFPPPRAARAQPKPP